MITFAIRNPIITLAIALALVVAGFWGWKHVPVDAIPDLSDNQVIVWVLVSWWLAIVPQGGTVIQPRVGVPAYPGLGFTRFPTPTGLCRRFEKCRNP